MKYKTESPFNELAFSLICEFCKNDIDCIYRQLLRIEERVSDRTLGFWVWDMTSNLERYSPKFRQVLGFSGVEDFPDTTESWQQYILPADLEIAIDNMSRHIESKGQHPYLQKVTYRKKRGGLVSLICHGKVVGWEDGKPRIAVGVHVPV